jgi:hypothetical protein
MTVASQSESSTRKLAARIRIPFGAQSVFCMFLCCAVQVVALRRAIGQSYQMSTNSINASGKLDVEKYRSFFCHGVTNALFPANYL